MSATAAVAAGVPVTQIEQLKAALEQNKKMGEFKIYPEAPHGFHADYRGSYRKDAAKDELTLNTKGRPIGRPFWFQDASFASPSRHNALRPCR